MLPPQLAKRIGLLLVTSLGFLLTGYGQDIHYSQFYNAPAVINPALTGVHGGDIRIAANWRNQWANVPVDYTQFTGFVDFKIPTRIERNGFFAAGLALNYDQAGDGKLQLLDLGLNGSYTHQLSDHFFGTLGAQLGFGQRTLSPGNFRWDNQFSVDRGLFDPNLDPLESGLGESMSFFDLGAGINFRWQAIEPGALVNRLDKRSTVDFGVGFHHLNEPDQSFYGGPEAPLFRRVSAHAFGVIQVAKSLDIVGNLNGQWQGPYTEYLGMIGARLHLNRDLGEHLAIQLGVGTRLNPEFSDAWYPEIEVFYRDWRVGFSYDFNISDFEIATDGIGGPELSIQYLIHRIPRVSHRICPII